MSAAKLPDVIVVGTPRSGTTWLAKLFDSHSRTRYRHEPDHPPLFPAMPRIVLDQQLDSFRIGLQRFAAALRKECRIRSTTKPPVFHKEGENHWSFVRRRVLTTGLRLLAKCVGNVRTPSWIEPPDSPGLVWVWKSVSSAGRLNVIADALTPVRVIHILRHPCGAVFSRLKGVERGTLPPISGELIRELREHGERFGRVKLETHVDPRGPLDQEALRWATLNSKAIGDLKTRVGHTIIRYEDLCRDPLALIGRLLRTCGLDLEPQVARFVTSSSTRRSNRFFSVYRSSDTLDAWRSQMDAASQSRVMQIVEQSEAWRVWRDGERLA